MTVFVFANNASTTLAGPVAASATTFSVAAGTGSLFPVPGTGQQFALTLISQLDSGQREIVYCTSRTSDSFTVVRGQEGTTSTAFVAGDGVNNFLTAGTTAAFTQAGQLQQQSGNYAIDTGTTNNLIGALVPTPASLALMTGVPVRIKVANTNTGSCILTLTPLAATTIIAPNGGSLTAGALVAGEVVEVIYNGSSYVLQTATGVFTDIGAGGVVVGGGNNANGANLLLKGSGTGSALNKTIRSINSSFQIVNSGYTSAIVTIDDFGNFHANGTIGSQGDIVANAGKLRASTGAFGSSDQTVATLLGDFLQSSSTTNGYVRLPSGWIIQGGVTALSAWSGTSGGTVTFPKAYASGCLAVTINEGGAGTWVTGNATMYSAVNRTTTGFELRAIYWNGSAWIGPPNGTTLGFTWIAIGI